VFILPFVIFAAPAGQVANHFENSWLARIFKRCEVFIILLAWLGLSQNSFWLMLLSLFLSSTQATFFGPIKYSLISAYLPTRDRVAGNGLIESSTFLAILLGTLTGGLIPKEYLGFIMLMGSLLCVYTSEKMVKTDVELMTTPIDLNVIKSTRKLIRFALKDRVLFLTIVGISWFWFIGCIVLTAIVPYTEQVINGEKEIASFFLFAFTVGIGAGSYICTMLLRGNLHSGYVPVAGFFMSVFLFDFVAISDTVNAPNSISLSEFLVQPYSWRIFFDLFMLAVFAGLYTVPLYATIQERLHPSRRGMGISANNMFNALFMVVASLAMMTLFALNFNLLQILLLTAALNLFVTLRVAAYVPESIRQIFVQF
ncbi:MAG: MFS transporter, partial [Alphaproteobacteria bacterium]|nr:MFS transporter [Alphaproteobacteria bacterium]